MSDAAVQQAEVDSALWRSGERVIEYSNRSLRPVEVVILARYRERLSGRVLEIGCGAGRVLGYLVELGGDAAGIDIAPAMVDQCRRIYPTADVRVGDLRDLGVSIAGPFNAVLAMYNVLDVVDDVERRRVLSDIHEQLGAQGLLVFSSHNLAHAEGRSVDGPVSGGSRGKLLSKLDRPPHYFVDAARRLPRRIRNRRRLAPLQRREADHAILNDAALDYGLLHYYIDRDDQERQLSELGFELLECLDLEGRVVRPGNVGSSPELHYVARKR